MKNQPFIDPLQDFKPVETEPKGRIWGTIGGGALTFAIVLHVILLIIGGIWVFQTTYEPEKVVDFLPGNGQAGGGERGAQYEIQQKKRAQITPTSNVKRVFAEGAQSTYAIPDPGDNFGQMSSLASLGGGGLSGGLGGSGSGKGFGSGGGAGAGGAGFQSIKMFGLTLENTEKIAVVMDVSRSMTRYLPAVAKELDKVAARGTLILYFGCGLVEPPRRPKIDDRVMLANGPAFDRYWQIWQGKTPIGLPAEQHKKLKYDPDRPMPLASIHKQMSTRLDTYFVEFNGIHYTQTALLAKEIGDADTIYWFADFQDKVEDSLMRDVLRKLKSNRQKLYIHSPVSGRFFEQVKDKLAVPSGGSAVMKAVK